MRALPDHTAGPSSARRGKLPQALHVCELRWKRVALALISFATCWQHVVLCWTELGGDFQATPGAWQIANHILHSAEVPTAC
jgi:hypothetical protein